MRHKLLLSTAMMLGVGIALAQQPVARRADNVPPSAAYTSPDVNADHTVTFHLQAPGASEVKVRIAGQNLPLTKSADGWWSVTTAPLQPDIYEYSYDVDGARVVSAGEDGGYDSIQVEIPGNPPRYDELQNVPHGSIVQHTYYSKIQDRERHFRVYLPPQYYSEPNRKFPVLYLFEGFDDTRWTTAGKVDIVLDNLIAQGKAVPMIIVMPFNRIHGETVAQIAPYAATAKNAEERDGLASSIDTIKDFEQELPQEIDAVVRADYRVYTDRDHQAIAGLSFGGGTAFGLGVRHLDQYAYVGEFATGTFGGTVNPTDGYVGYGTWSPDNLTPHLFDKLRDSATAPKLLYFSVGESDPRRPAQEKAYAQFKAEGIKNLDLQEYPGGHEYKFFRRAMADFVSKIFK